MSNTVAFQGQLICASFVRLLHRNPFPQETKTSNRAPLRRAMVEGFFVPSLKRAKTLPSPKDLTPEVPIKPANQQQVGNGMNPGNALKETTHELDGKKRVIPCLIPCISRTSKLFGCGSKLTRRGYAGFGPCVHLPGFHFSTGFLSHTRLCSSI